MEWSLAHPLHDVEDIVELADSQYGPEIDGIITRSRDIFRHRVTVAATEQLFNKGKEFLAVCRTEKNWVAENGDLVEDPDGGKLLAFCWFDRGGYTAYSNEEISNSKFQSVYLNLSPRLRVRLINEMIDQHILWAARWGVPIVCASSIRSEHDGFMRILKKRGFSINGSYAWIRTEEGVKCLTK